MKMSNSSRRSKFITSKRNDCGYLKDHLNEVQTLLNNVLTPVIHKISVLTDMVSSLLSLINVKEVSDANKKGKNYDCGGAGIATDVTMIASSVHRLTKNYEIIKEQVTENKKNIEKFYRKLQNVEKLLITFLKAENNRDVKKYEEQILKKLSNVEKLLLGELVVNHSVGR